MPQYIKYKNIKFFLILTCVTTFSCFNPFFPLTGTPPASPKRPIDNTLRSTPLGVIKQLIDAYQKRDIDLYRDLFSVNQDFRFYVLPTFTSSHIITTCEKVDSLRTYISSKGLTCLNYWTYTAEMISHTHLFELSEQIDLACNSINPSDIRFIVGADNETTNVEIIMRGGRMEIDGQVWTDTAGNRYQDQYTVDNIGEQVFYLEKDPQNPGLWVIQKWFDLNAFQ